MGPRQVAPQQRNLTEVVARHRLRPDVPEVMRQAHRLGRQRLGAPRVSVQQGGPGDAVERGREPASIVEFAPDLERFFQVPLSTREVGALREDRACAMQGRGPHDAALLRSGQCQQFLQAVASLTHRASSDPETPEGGAKPQRLGVRALGLQPVERHVEVAALPLQTLEPETLVRSGQMRRRLLGQRQEVRSMRVSDLARVLRGAEELPGVLLDRRQHGEPRFVRTFIDRSQQTVVQQRRHRVLGIERHVVGGVAHGRRGIEREATRERRKTTEVRAFVGTEQVVTPSDRLPQRLLPGGAVDGAPLQQIEAAAEPRQHRLRREELDARGRQLDGQWKAVEVSADARHGGGVLLREREVRPYGAGALEEQRDGRELRHSFWTLVLGVVGHGKGRDHRLALEAEAHHDAAGRQHHEVWACLQEPRDDVGPGNHLLDVVEHEQCALRRQVRFEHFDGRTDPSIGERERLRDAIGDSRRVGQRSERHEERAVRERLGHALGHLDRQAGLPYPAGARERHQARAPSANHPGQRSDIRVTTDDRPGLGREVPGTRVERLQNREVVDEAVDLDLPDALGTLEVLQGMHAQVPQRQSIGKVPFDQPSRRLRQKHLPPVPRRGDARCAEDVEAGVDLVRHRRFTRVHAHANAHRRTVGPIVARERPLGIGGRDDGGAGAGEHHERTVAGGPSLHAAVPLGGAQQEPSLLHQYLRESLAEELKEPRRALDVGEQVGLRALRGAHRRIAAALRVRRPAEVHGAL